MCENQIQPDIFDCRQCGDCCTGFGGTYVTEDDISAIAGFISVSLEEMRTRYCQPAGGDRIVLACGENGKCVFHKDRLCSIHPVKPRMCREWPFIPGVLRHPENWRMMGGACPGILKDAPLDAIRTRTAEELARTRPGFTQAASTDLTD